MKKELIFGMLAAAVMLLAASCTNDDLDTPVQPEEQECLVTFTVAQPGLSTRAYSQGSEATSLTYAAYITGDTDKTAILSDEIENAFDADLKATVTLSLVSGKTYDVIFWADSPDGPYTFNAEADADAGTAAQTVTVDYTGVLSQDESLDAFYGSVKSLTVGTTELETVTLTRPFAQLNIATIDADAAKTAGFVPTQSQVTVTSVYSTFDIYNGAVSGDAAEVTYASAAIPSGETFPYSGTDGNTTSYTYLSMNYLLVGSGETTIDIDLTVSDASSNTIERNYYFVPVQPNYRTNLYGNLLTESADFTIEIVDAYDGSKTPSSL